MKRLPLFLGIILVVLGVIGLAHPSFNYHQKEEVAKVGPFKATVDEEKPRRSRLRYRSWFSLPA